MVSLLTLGRKETRGGVLHNWSLVKPCIGGSEEGCLNDSDLVSPCEPCSQAVKIRFKVTCLRLDSVSFTSLFHHHSGRFSVQWKLAKFDGHLMVKIGRLISDMPLWSSVWLSCLLCILFEFQKGEANRCQEVQQLRDKVGLFGWGLGGERSLFFCSFWVSSDQVKNDKQMDKNDQFIWKVAGLGSDTFLNFHSRGWACCVGSFFLWDSAGDTCYEISKSWLQSSGCCLHGRSGRTASWHGQRLVRGVTLWMIHC